MKNGNYQSECLRTINEFYSKCHKQSNDISDDINDIKKGKHPIGAIDKVKSKVLEKLDNYDESLKTMELLLQDLKESEKEIWKKYLYFLINIIEK
jgi:hypothetical protein